MKFVHLHAHTHYSLLDGLTKLDEAIEEAVKDGQPALAITDHGTMYGVIEFYQKCKKAGIKPIIGVETYLAKGSRHEKNFKIDEKSYYHLLLLAKNSAGYKNLIKLTTIGHLEGFYYKPRIDWETLIKYHEGLIALTACLGGEIPTLILSGKLEKAKQRAIEYKELFGPGNFYFEIMPHHELPGQDQANEAMRRLSLELDIPLAATNDVHYLRKEDDEAQDILLCLQNKKKKDDTDRMNMTGSNFSMRTSREMSELLSDFPEAIANTVKIADECNLEIELEKIQLPHFIVPDGYDGNSFLRKLCEDGLVKRYGASYAHIDSGIKERMDYELKVIGEMGWSSYFLIVADFVNWAKENRIVVGPGRGSAAGSLVCYLAGVTNIDPLKYELLFERFLNPDRVSMPDIDMDFADTRRNEVIDYVEKKYGQDHVAQIITFGTMAARAAVRDVGRVLNFPYDYCDRLAKMIPMFTKINEALSVVPELKEIYAKEEAARSIIDYAKRLEGVARHASTHACGVVITNDPLTEYVPLQYASSSDKTIISQYSLHPIEDLGLLKMDFLGLKNLTIIESAIKIIKNTRGIAIDIDSIPLNDKKTYDLFKDGETTGVFQFESSGMKRYLKELKPTEFEDIIAMVALYRPGPMEWIPDYIAGKHARRQPKYLHPKLEPILKKTHGVAIYQEQVMQMARDLAGFTMAEADVLRKAVGKKIHKLLVEQKEKFVDGCVKNGVASDLAEKIFSFIEPFAGYGFNRSHAACYAMIAHQTAYLKAHWPTEFMAALLASDQHDIDRVAVEIEECQRMGLKVFGPDINESFESFTVVTSGTGKNQTAAVGEKVDTIRFGLSAVKNIGEHISEVLIAERKKNGPYQNIEDLLERITDKDLNKKSLESLIKSGALDQFGERGRLLANIDRMLAFNKEAAQVKNNGQVSLFSDAPALFIKRGLKLENSEPTGRQIRLSWEKELLGLYVSEHPFSDYKKYTEGITTPLLKLNDIKASGANGQVVVAGVITKISKILTRQNQSMIFAKIEDESGHVEILIFPTLLKSTASIWIEGRAVICQGKVSYKDQEIKILANRADFLDLENISKILAGYGRNGRISAVPDANSRRNNAKEIKILFDQVPDKESLEELKLILSRNKGDSKVLIQTGRGDDAKIIETGFMVNYSDFLIVQITKKFGQSLRIE